MNRTQKVAWWVVIGISVMMASLAMVMTPMFFFGRPIPRLVCIACLAINITVASVGFFIAFGKQREVETDEMDITIHKIAAVVALAGVLVVVGISLIIADLVWGLNFTVPLWVLMLLYGALLFIGSIVYWAAVLVQYSRRSKNGE
jgi:hypothetical protein